MDEGFPDAAAIRAARQAKGWTMANAARALKQRYGTQLPAFDSLVRAWKRWEKGTSPSRQYRPLLADLLDLDVPGPIDLTVSPFLAMAEIPEVFANQAAAADEIRAQAEQATSIDVLAVRGLGLVALNDSLLRPALERAATPARLRMLILRPDSDAARRRATEIGESHAAFTAGLDLTIGRLRELDSVGPGTVEVYTYDTLPAWRLIALDDTFYVSAFSEDWEGHESAVYKIVPTEAGPLHRSFRRMFGEMREQALRII